jgi:hypothetical protein
MQDGNRVARRSFIRSVGVVTLGVMAGGFVRAQGAAGSSVNVKDKGAKGDGLTDDTDAFQAAVNSLPAAGGTVAVPAGSFLIDASRSIRLKSGTTLRMEQGTRLVAKPNSLDRSYVVLVEGAKGVVISGGAIVGERDHHTGTTGEWGHGIYVRGSVDVSISDVHISSCWGDGICIGAIPQKGALALKSSAIRIQRVVSTGNRRQGLSIGPAEDVRITECEFSNTNGTKPSAGVDIEPEQPETAARITVSGCRILNNAGPGIQIYRFVEGAQVENCEIRGNAANGVLIVGASGSTVSGSTIADSGLSGVLVRGGANASVISGNTLSTNGRNRAAKLLQAVRQGTAALGASGDGVNIQVMSDASGTQLANNRLDP